MPVPSTDNEFNTYIINSTAYLLSLRGGTNIYVLLGITVAEKDMWVAKLAAWTPVWTAFSSEATRTVPIKNTKNDMKTAFIAFASPLLIRMGTSLNIVEADRSALVIPVREEQTARGPITTAPNTSMSPMEGGQIKVDNRVDNEASRSSMHPLADAIEMKYKIGAPAPANASACPNNFMSSKALFIFDGGQENDGKKLYVYTRWVNISNHANDGPWSPLAIATISAGTPDA